MGQQTSKKIKLDIDVSKDYNKMSKKYIKVILFCTFVTIFLCLVDLSIGNVFYNPFSLIIDTITGQDSDASLILLNLRMPHVLCSLIAGAIMGICGCVLQSSLGNPLASPSTIGVSQGAACGACFAIICLGSFIAYEQVFVLIFAFVFAIIPALIIFMISKFKKLNATSIILTGVAMTIFFGGIIAIIEYFADSSKVSEVIFWTFGSVSNANYVQLAIMGVFLIFVFIYSQLNSMKLNALECGDVIAHSIGLNTINLRLLYIIIAAISAGCVTSICGTINFIGLIAPHIMRWFVGSNYKKLIPASALCGASLILVSDILSRVILSGVILPIGAITSILGAPMFVLIMLTRKK